MLTRSCLRSWALATVTAISVACGASASQADVASMLQNLKANPGATEGRQLLPAVQRPRWFRESKLVTCNTTHQALGPNLCLVDLDAVPSGHLLQIDNVNCIGGTTGDFVLFNSQLKFERIIGVVLSTARVATASSASGPYYLRAHERPRLLANANGPGVTAVCAVFGTLWQTS